MANRRTITNNQLTPDKTFLVRGKVGYSHITRPTTDDERANENKRRTHPINRNYTHISIYDAQVMCIDPQNPSLEERYASESLYRSSNPKYTGFNYSAMNQSRNLPMVGVVEETNPNNYVQIVPQAELAIGLDVTLVMRVFKGTGNNGVSLDRVLVNEPIKYYSGSTAIDQTLANFGITFKAKAPEAPVVAEDPQEVPAPVPMDNAGFAPAFAPAAMPAPAPAPAPAPMPAPMPAPAATDNPFSSYAAPNDISFGPGPQRQY